MTSYRRTLFLPFDVSFHSEASLDAFDNNNSSINRIELCNLETSFKSDDSLLSHEPWLKNAAVECNAISKEQEMISNQTERLVSHYLKFNQSYNGMEEMSHIMNLMDNVSIQVPESRYRIMKQINPQFKVEFQIFCSKCKCYTPTSNSEVLCSKCLENLKTSKCNYFVYIPIEQQLRKVIKDNWNEILSYPNPENGTIRDVHDCIQYVKVQQKYGDNFKIHACGYCLHPGVPIKNKKKEKVTNIVRYIRRENPDDLRNHKKMLEIYKKLKGGHGPIDGIKEISCMVAAPDFDLTFGFGIDYMHCILLGVMGKCLSLWLDSCHHNEPFYIKPKHQTILSKRIINIKPISEISRKPGAVAKRKDYKANELRTLLLYYLRYSLVGLLKKCYVDHFQLLSSSIYALLKDNISLEDIDCAEIKLNEFSDKFEKLYGKHNVTMNIHLIRHLANSVRNLGPLWAQSTFALEANNGIITKTTAKRSILHSVSFKYNARWSLSANQKNEPNISLKGEKNIRLTLNEVNILRIGGFHVGKSYSMEIYERVSIQKTEFSSKNSKEISTIDYFVELKNNTKGAVIFFFTSNYTVYVFIEMYEVIEVISKIIYT